MQEDDQSSDKKWDVFISYASKDKGRVNTIADKLTEEGVSVFLDSASIKPGGEITHAIERGLSKSERLLVFFSREAARSSWVKSELTTFLENVDKGHHSVIPVLFDDTSPKELPSSLHSTQCIYWSNDEQQDIKSIIEAIGLSARELEQRSATKRALVDATTYEKIKRFVQVEITLTGDFDTFSGKEQDAFLEALARSIDVDASELSIDKKERGSVKYQFSLSPEQAARVFFAINNGEMDELRQFDVQSVSRVDDARRIAIGHGRSLLWREVKDFVAERLKLPWDEFNREPVAGLTTTERLDRMVKDACFALLVMTAEDLHADNEMHARESAVHEIGLFQGRLGPRRAIILVEDGCAEFSNIRGLTQIRFPKGQIGAVFEQVRQVVEREGLLQDSFGR